MKRTSNAFTPQQWRRLVREIEMHRRLNLLLIVLRTVVVVEVVAIAILLWVLAEKLGWL
jgi:hypothetical protein